MKINENRILEDAQKAFDLSQKKSYSRTKKFEEDINAINYVFVKVSNKYFYFSEIYNPYHERLSIRSDAKSLYDYSVFVFSCMDHYIKLAENYLNLLEENNFTRTEINNGKVYSPTQIKEIILDFFNEQGVDKYKIVKSMFDEERVEISKLDLDGAEAVCSIMTSDIKPYVIVDSNANRVTLNGISNLAHEFGHAIEGHMNFSRYNRRHYDRNLIFSEISSKFYEYEFCKYLQRNRIELRNANSLVNEFHAVNKNFCEGLVFAFDKEITKDGEKYTFVDDAMAVSDKRDLQRCFRKEGEDENLYVFEFSLYKPLKYGIGGLAALNLHEIKRQDPQEFNRLWNHFLSMRTLMSENDILDLFGISLEELTSCSRINEMVKNDINTYNKQLKRQL